MPEEFYVQQRKRADAHVARFLEAHSGYSLVDKQPQWLKGTHLVTFGAYCGKPAVFKFYDGTPRRGHEKRALELFLPSGLVPEIYGETDDMLVMERLPGSTIHEIENDLTSAEWDELNFHLGGAVAKVVETAPGRGLAAQNATSFRACDQHDFYNTPFDALSVLYREADTATFFDTTVGRAARALRDKNVPHKDTLAQSLAALQRNRDAILAFPSFIHMDDFHDNNIMADRSKITGFIDLEMTRSGNEILLLGAALFNMCRQPGRWPCFRAGYENARGTPLNDSILSLIRCAAPFSTWIRFTWYWSTDDQPWWAEEMDLRSSAVRDVKNGLEAVEGMKP